MQVEPQVKQKPIFKRKNQKQKKNAEEKKQQPKDKKDKKQVYLKDWDLFLQTTIEILLDNPQSRATLKYNEVKQTAILKVTDGKKLIMFKVRAQKPIIRKQEGVASKQPARIEDTHFTQMEQFIKLTSKIMLKVDPNEEVKEPTVQKIEEEEKGGKQKKKKGKGKNK